MFWGLIMEPNKRYSQTVESSFHVSMATLDVTTADDEIVQVMMCYESRNYLLCNLSKKSQLQMPLDLCFKNGTKIAFTSNGRGHVHLTGYYIPDEDSSDFEIEDEEEEEDEDEEVPQLVGKQAKRKAQTSPADSKLVKRIKNQTSFEEPENDDDTEDDSDAEGENSEDDSDDDIEDVEEEEEGEEEEEDSDEDEDEEEEEIETKPQQKKNKQNKQKNEKAENQKPQKQQNSLTNGKDAKVTKEQPLNNSQLQKKKVIAGGVQIEDIKPGNGPVAKQGKMVSVYYVGRLKNGKKFDSTTNGNGFKFRLGKGEVIKGWDVGVQGMKVGGKRRITIPPAMAYGAKGSPPVIPGNSTLTFEVELKNVH
ncbi:hypothetical protein PV327_008239 [Microctonus hyperodae]|uniref:FK506-binding protein n=1 Tax=Microctonus hyperodae TaxID=165561 RepID=A0AA39F2Q6_MICHY|nr:hypothetical protein PV327_008239 [Microctonus hyperodae]